MNLIIRPATLRDLPGGMACIRDHFLLDEPTRARLLGLWQELLTSGSGLALVVVDQDARPAEPALLAFAIGAFLTPPFAEELRRNDEGVTLIRRVLRWQNAGQSPFLTSDDIRRANTHRMGPPTLTLTTLHSGTLPHLQFSEEGRFVRDRTAEFNYLGLNGYRLYEYFTETYGESSRVVMQNLGFTSVHQFWLDRVSADDRIDGVNATGSRGEMWSITHEQARQNEGAPMASLFLYRPPCFGLNPGEQEMLLFALAGVSDENIADLMSVAVGDGAKTLAVGL